MSFNLTIHNQISVAQQAVPLHDAEQREWHDAYTKFCVAMIGSLLVCTNVTSISVNAGDYCEMKWSFGSATITMR